ncbi:MAG: hypothetical protein ABJR05_17010 [Balneola sp.]
MKSIVFFFFVLITLGCSYSPNGSNYINSETDITPINISYSISPSAAIDDTLHVYGGIQIDFDIELNGKFLEGMNYWLDNDTLSQWADYDDSYYRSTPIGLNTNTISDGFHALHFEFTTNSGRKNVADLLGSEYVVYRDSIQFIVENNPPSAPRILEMQKSDGDLLINWTTYRGLLFKNYYISRQYTENNITYTDFIPNGVVDDQSVSIITDKHFLGGEFSYIVTVLTEKGNTTSDPFIYSDEYPQIQNVVVSDSEILVEWTRCKYPGSFAKYEIFAPLQSKSDIIINIESIIDTSVTFGYDSELPSEIRLITKSKTIESRTNQIIDVYDIE